ncbi:MAG: 50S ribosomal protein L9 [Sphingomonadaceae bacterium]|nr:50S ribosomal protein L9 [Sphingomonadaceae bacterium]
MDIILLERIEKLGAIGDVVSVKDGYARNYLLPNKKALRANEGNRKLFEANRAKIEADNAARRGDAEGQAKTVAGAKVVLIRQASNAGQLYGSVSVRDIVEALHEAGHNVVTKAMVVLERPIKTLGLFDVRVNLHPEVQVLIEANVARSPDEAALQAEGVNVIDQQFAAEEAEAAAAAEEFLETQAEATAEQDDAA